MAICLPQKFKINIIYIIFRTYKDACSVRNKESITDHEEPASDSSVQPRCTLSPWTCDTTASVKQLAYRPINARFTRRPCDAE